VAFQWDAVPGAETYHLWVAARDDVSRAIYEDSTVATTAFTAGPFTPGAGYYWRVRPMNKGGAGPWSVLHSFTVSATGTGIERVGEDLPHDFALHPNYPNPFNPSTTVPFDLPEAAHVSLLVYDPLGRVVATLVSGPLPAGRYRYTWDAPALPSGVYLYRLRAGAFTQTRRLLLLK
jgi:hypothetical protein